MVNCSRFNESKIIVALFYCLIALKNTEWQFGNITLAIEQLNNSQHATSKEWR